MIQFHRLLTKLKRYCRIVLFSKKRFTVPLRAKVLIYDGVGNGHLLRLLHPLKPEILFTRGEELNVAVFLKALFKKGRITDAYEDCYINCVMPLVVITFIDNAPRFYLLSERYPQVKTIFVQNGWRGGVFDIFHTTLNYLAAPAKARNVDIMCTFGEAIGAEYRKHITGKYIAIGSLVSNEYPVAADRKKIRRVAYISIFNETNDFAARAVELVLQELMCYSLSRRIPLVIVGRSTCDSEESYYRELLGSNIEFQRRDGRHGSYKYLDESEVSVSIDSSLGYETVARHNKNAFFSVLGYFHKTNEFNFGWPASYAEEGPFWTNKPVPAVFERILDHLFGIDGEQWQTELADYGYANIMTYDPGNVIVKAVLKRELDEPDLASGQASFSQNHRHSTQ